MFRKDEFTGDFVDGWKATLNDTGLTQVSYTYVVHVLRVHVCLLYVL